METQKLKSKYPTAKQIADGVEYLSPIKELQGWTIFVQYDLTEDPKDDDAWIDDFLWGVKKPPNGKKRRRISLGTQQLGIYNLHRLPEEAQGKFQKYVHECWQKKIDAVVKEMERRWDAEELADDDDCDT